MGSLFVIAAQAGIACGERAVPSPAAPAFAGATWKLAVFGAALLLAACGKEEDLKPVAGHPMPVKPATAPAAATVGQLLAPPSQTRPERVDDLVHKSQERRDDRFDLPPPG